jgi:TfoX/Sxy family transcriptional regulator of competence genes
VDSDFIVELFAPFGPVTVRRLFGGGGLFAQGLMFGLVFDGAIFLKVDDASIPDFEREGSVPFVYTRAKSPGRVGRHSLSYWRLPERLYDDPEVDRAKFTKQFIDETAQYGYVKLDTKTREVEFNTEDQKLYRDDMKSCLHFMPNPLQAELLYKLIVKGLPENILNTEDLSFTLSSQKGNAFRVSLIDYLFYLTVSKTPPDEVIKLHEYLKTLKLSIPHCMNRNPFMQ